MKLSTGDHKTRDQKPNHFLRPGCTETVGREMNPETRALCVSSGRTLNALTVDPPKLFAMPNKRAQKSLPAIRRRDASGLRRSPADARRKRVERRGRGGRPVGASLYRLAIQFHWRVGMMSSLPTSESQRRVDVGNRTHAFQQ